MKEILLLFVSTIVILMMWVAFSSSFTYICRQTFGGVWSSIVIDDCFGSFWAPTVPVHFDTMEEIEGSSHPSYLRGAGLSNSND